MTEKLVSLYVDSPSWSPAIRPDDFLVTIGVKQSNSVYHVAEVKTKERAGRIHRHYIKAFRSDLQTAIRRGDTQKIIPLYWYKR